MRHFDIDIWKGVDEDLGSDGQPRPYLSAYVLDGERARGAVLVIPGGAYSFVSPREAEPIAMRATASGRHAFVLRYSVAPRRFPQSLLDAARSLRLIRDGAAEWKLEPSRVAAIGFSAGGHLAASLAFLGREALVAGARGIEGSIPRPDALGLVYPVISSGPFAHRGSFDNLLGPEAPQAEIAKLSLENRVPEDCPPVFLVHTAPDPAVPVENSLLLAIALRERRVPFELHVFPRGVHGISLSTAETATPDKPAEPRAARWVELFFSWLDETLPES
jgi:acetyl esterase/lipase